MKRRALSRKRPEIRYAPPRLALSCHEGESSARWRRVTHCAIVPGLDLSTMKKITVVSPCFNEEDNVETCYETVKAIFERDLPGYAREHIFVDNASQDRTVEILRGIAAKDPSVKVCLLYTSPSPRDRTRSRMPSSA